MKKRIGILTSEAIVPDLTLLLEELQKPAMKDSARIMWKS